MKVETFILLGAPGAGKGTVATKICELDSTTRTISTGQLLRDEIAKQTPLGKKVEKILAAGLLVDDNLMGEVLDTFLTGLKSVKVTRLFLDGFPRTVPQAMLLEDLAKKHDILLRGAICLEVPHDILMKRLTGRRVCKGCGATFNIYFQPPRQENICDVCHQELTIRSDDNPSTVQERLRVYTEKTQPLIQFYREKKMLRVVDASRQADETVKSLLSACQDLGKG